MMGMTMPETCSAYKKLVFYSSFITMMHGPINIRFASGYSLLIVKHYYPDVWHQCCVNTGQLFYGNMKLKHVLSYTWNVGSRSKLGNFLFVFLKQKQPLWAPPQNCEKRQLASSCLSVRLHWKTRLQLDGFSRNLILRYFSKTDLENSSFIKTWK